MNAVLVAPICPSITQIAAGGEPRRIRILIVDDDADIRRLEARILKNAGHHVDTAADGESAWRALRGGDYNLLVIDHIMPGISGLALVRQLRVASIALPVVMVSGSLETLDTARLSRDPRSRINAFVRKPFTIPDLLAAVHSSVASETTQAMRY